MSDVTRILSRIDSGDPSAAEKLLPLVYDELRKLAAARLAQEQPGQTLQATALVHEAYLRLVGTDKGQRWNSRGHFFAAAAESIRRILIENARRKGRLKHGDGKKPQPLSSEVAIAPEPDDDVLALDTALQKFAPSYPLHARLIELRYFAGLTGAEAAGMLGISPSTADRHWVFARAWLLREMASCENS